MKVCGMNRRLRMEDLEARLLLAFDLTIYDDLVANPRSRFGGPVTEDSVYYVDTDLQNGSELHRLDLATLESSLVADLAPGFGDSSPQDFVVIDDSQIAFTAFDPVHGKELRLLDTANNSISTIDFAPGETSSFPDVRLVFGEKLVVVATDPVHGEALRIVDVADRSFETIEIAGATSDPELGEFHAHDETLFFTARTEQEGHEPRLLDLSSLELSTIDIAPGFESSAARDAVLADNVVYFVAGGFNNGMIHLVDLEDGSLSVNDQIPLPVRFSSLYPSGDKVFFVADDDAHGRELRALDSDLQFATIDIMPGSVSSQPDDIFSIDGTLFLSAVDGDHGKEVWSVDTESYDTTVYDLNPGPANSVVFNFFSIENNRVGFFSPGSSTSELWVVDPVDAEVAMFEFGPWEIIPDAREAGGKYFFAIDAETVGVFDPGSDTLSEIDITAGSPNPQYMGFVATGEQILVTAVNAAGEFRIHSISTLDNTVTESVEVYAGADSTLSRYIGNLTEIDDRVFFGGLRTAEIGANEMSAVNNEDGTLSDSGYHAVVGDYVLFEGTDPEYGSELRIFNTVDDSLTTVDINPGPDSSNPSIRNENFFAIGTRLFFAASDLERGQELRIYDTADGSLTTVDLDPGSGSSIPLLREGQSLFDGERLYFPATTTAVGREIHFYDVTDGSVGAIDVNLEGDSVSGFEEELVAAEGKLYFSAFDWIHGMEVRAFDPVDDSITTFDVSSGAESSNPGPIGVHGSSVFFVASDSDNGSETRVIDATTDELSTFDIYPGPDSARPFNLTAVGDHLFLSADSPGVFQALHRIDFSSLEVETWEASPSFSRFPSELVNVEGELYFNARDKDLGWELHVFDTVNESFSVIDVNPGPGSSFPSNLVFDDERLYFSVGQFGTEFGNEIGVVELEDKSSIVIDLVEGPDSSSAGIYNGIFVGESGAYFLAQKPGFGIELFGLQYTPSVLDFDNDGSLGCHDVNTISTAVAMRSTDLSFDVNGDQQIDKLDLDRWLVLAGREMFGEGRRIQEGDANLDGVVDVSDFNIWNTNRISENSNWCSGDFNADGFIDVSDFNIWNSNQFVSPAGQSPANNSTSLPGVVPIVFEAPAPSRHTQTSLSLQLIDRVFEDDDER